MLTGKNKQQFEEWYAEHFKCMNPLVQSVNQFYQLERFEMQLGVFLAYYDSKGIPISIEYFDKYNEADEGFYFKVGKKSFYIDNVFNTRNEACKEAFKQADKLMNQSVTL